MKIWTGYYGGINFYNKHHSNMVYIAISGKPPNNWNYFHYKKLAPSYSIWKEYNDSNLLDKIKIYTDRFNNEILSQLNPIEVINDLTKISQQNIVLCCYEKPPIFCHRHLVADWLNEALNIGINELPNKLK